MIRENEYTIVGSRPRDEMCYQFVFGDTFFSIGDAYDKVRTGAYQKIDPEEGLQQEDVVFYLDIFYLPTHVGKVDDQGRVLSKSPAGPNVYRHTLFGPPVPDSYHFDTVRVFRPK